MLSIIVKWRSRKCSSMHQ